MNFRLQSRYIWASAGLVVVLSIAVAAWASASNNGQILPLATRTSAQTPAQTQAYRTYNGSYMTFRYSGRYQPHNLVAKDMDLELSMLSADTNYEKRLAVAVSNLAGGSLDNNSANLLRKSQPFSYSSRQVSVDGAAAVVWTKADGLEQTVLIPHGDKVAVLSFSTVGTVDDLGVEVDTLLTTFRWKT